MKELGMNRQSTEVRKEVTGAMFFFEGIKGAMLGRNIRMQARGFRDSYVRTVVHHYSLQV
jgi:hypothetical protein